MRKLQFSIGGETVEIGLRSQSQGQLEFLYKGRSYRFGCASSAGGRVVVSDHSDPKQQYTTVYRYHKNSLYRSAQQLEITELEANGEERERSVEPVIKADFPGTIVAVHAQLGETVAAEQDLITIESMKLQRQLQAPVAGTVKAILVGENDVVKSGQELLLIEPKGGDSP